MSTEQVNSNPQSEKATNGGVQAEQSIEHYVEQGKRAYALRQYESAIEQYATALELSTAKYGDRAPESADLLFEYGKALIENAIVQSAVLSKEEKEKDDDDDEEGAKKDPRFNFESDADGEPDEELNLATLPDDEEEEEDEGAEEEEQGDEESPEDDFNAAWEVLDLARVIYEKRQDEDDEIKLKLADTYLALGDVSLETEKFDQAIDDYTTAINLKNEILPFSSRQIAEGHLKLALVLDITSGRLADAINHVELSVQSVEERLSELRLGSQSQPSPEAADPSSPKKDIKGKGKARKLVRDPAVISMSAAQIEDEVKDLEGMKTELQMKLDEIKTNPAADAQGNMPGAGGSGNTAPELAARQLDKELNSAAAAAASKVALMASEVKDLSGLVKKKKKVIETGPGDREPQANGLKRKSPEEVDERGPDKRPKISEGAQPSESA